MTESYVASPGQDSKTAVLPLVEHEGEPRVRDVEIGERLGMARPTNIRQVIEANRQEIQTFGAVHSTRALVQRPQGGSVSVTEFWLNEEQALCVSTLSKAPRAPEVRAMLIRTFTAWRHGKLTTATPINVRDPAQGVAIVQQYQEWIGELQAENAVLRPKAELLDEMAGWPGVLDRDEVGKLLKKSTQQITAMLKQHGWIHQPDGAKHARGCKPAEKSGLVDHRPMRISNTGEGYLQVVLTWKGLVALGMLFYPGDGETLWPLLQHAHASRAKLIGVAS